MTGGPFFHLDLFSGIGGFALAALSMVILVVFCLVIMVGLVVEVIDDHR